MTCEDLQKMIHVHLEEAESDDHQQVIFGHIAGCWECRAFFDTILRTRSAGQREQIIYPVELDDTLLPLFSRTSGGHAAPRRLLFHRLRAASHSNRLAISYPLVIVLCSVMFGLGILLKETLAPPPASIRIPVSSTAQSPTVIMIYSLPPVEVQGIPVRQVMPQPQEHYE